MEARSRDAGRPRERWQFRWWWIPAYVIGYMILGELLEAGMDRLVATGGYGLSNAVVGLLGVAFCFVLIQRTHVRHRKLETDGDPKPLPASTDYVTMATPTVVLCWMAGVVAWAVTLMLLALFGPSSAWVLGPIVGTGFILGARMESLHAKAMDARRGRPPAPAAHG